MTAEDSNFAGSIPECYDRYLVPLLFEDYAVDLANHVVDRSPADVLETAAGSGVVTRALAPKLQPDARYVVTDLNQPMLDHAARRQGQDSRIVWQQADASSLPFADAAFDVVCCQFGVMFFSDKVRAYREALRVLRQKGVFLFNSWDRIETNVFAETVAEALASIFPQDPPSFLARTPYGYHDAEAIRNDLREAGFGSVSIAAREASSRAPTAHDVAIAFCKGTPLRNEIEARDPTSLCTVVDQVASDLAIRFGAGPVSASMRAHFVIAQA